MALFKKRQTRDESYYMASQWTLMWRKLQKHKLARFSLVILAILVLVILLFRTSLGLTVQRQEKKA